ncbi:hypothetical protein K8R43_04085 [archaeon]|nr:hypothetical protein [archaeon]
MIDTFTLVVFLILIMITLQVQRLEIAAVIILIFLLTLKSHTMIFIVLIAGAIGYIVHQTLGIELQLVMISIVVLIIAAAMFTNKKEGPGAYTPGMFGVI